MRDIQDFARIVYAYFIKKADAERDLKAYLEAHLRRDLIERIQIKNLLKSVSNRSGAQNKDEFQNDLVDNLIKNDIGDDIEPMLVSKVKREFNLDSSTAHKIIGSSNPLSPEEKETFNSMSKDLIKIISQYLFTSLTNAFKELVKEEQKKTDVKKEITPEEAIPPEHELEQDMLKSDWEQGLIKDIIHLINIKIPEDLKKRSTYKLILTDILLKKFTKKERYKLEELKKDLWIEKDTANRPEKIKEIQEQIKKLKDIQIKEKTLEQIAKKTDTSISTVSRYEKDLVKNILTPFLETNLKGRQPKEQEETEKVHKNYETELKNKENSDSFKNFVKDKFGPRISENTKNIMNLFADGLSKTEIEQKGFKIDDINNTKKLYFIPWYSEWYNEMNKEANYYIKQAFQILKQSKRVIIPHEKVDEPETSESSASHEKMVDNAIADHLIKATIYFSADYDILDVIAKRKDPKKDPINFKYTRYEATLNLERKYGKVTRSIDYTYIQNLRNDGEFIGTSKSTLKLEGQPVSDGLKKDLDNYVEHHMKPEGMLPFGHSITKVTKNILFPVSYVNEKFPNNSYPNVHMFHEKFRGLGPIEDQAHKTRTEIVDESEKRRALPITESKKIKELIHDFKYLLEEEEDKKPRNTAEINRIQAEIKRLQHALSGKEEQKDIEDLIEKEMQFLKPKAEPEKTAAIFPAPVSEKLLKLITIFEKYGITKPNPYGWLLPVDLLTLAKSVIVRSEVKREEKIKALKKTKGLDKTEKGSREVDINNEINQDVYDAQDLFKEYPEDLKTRRDKLKEKNPKEFAEFSKGKNITWVDNKNEIDRIITKIHTEFKEKKIKKPVKIHVLRSLEHGKFVNLENFLVVELSGFDVLSKRLNNASVVEKTDPETTHVLKDSLDKTKMSLEKAQEELKGVSEKSEEEVETEKIELLRDNIPKYVQEIDKLKKSIADSTEFPALNIIKVIQGKAEYFSPIYSYLSSILWFGQYAVLKSAAEDENLKDLNSLKSKIVSATAGVASNNILASEKIKSGLRTIKTLCQEYITEHNNIQDKIMTAASLPYNIIEAAEEKTLDEKRTEFMFPGDELHAANKIMENLKNQKLTEKFYGIAHKEYEDILKNVRAAFREGFDEESLKKMAEKKGVSIKEASILLKHLKDALAGKALRDFNLKWKDVIDRKGRPAKKERSPLGNRPSTEYDEMGHYVERHLPKLFEIAPPEEDFEEPERGIATPKEIREMIEKAFTRSKPAEMTEKYEPEEDEFKLSGPAKSKSVKKHEKALKINPPNISFEVLKDKISKLLMEKPAEYVVLYTLAHYTKRLQESLEHLKEGEYIDAGDVIDYFVHMLKRLQSLIVTLKVEPSSTIINLIKTMHPDKLLKQVQFSGRPDLIIDSHKAAVDLFDKIVDVYKIINKYIAPDEVGIPPENISEIRSKSGIAKKYLPPGLVDWYQHLEELEKREKKASELPMVLRLAQKFSYEEIQKIDTLKEADLFK